MIFLTYVAVMGRRYYIFKLFSIENVNANKVAFSMTMLPGLGGRNFHNLLQETLCMSQPKEKERIFISRCTACYIDYTRIRSSTKN